MLNCLVVGSGIAGLASALSLHEAGQRVSVYESHPGPSDSVGVFLTMAVNGFDALDTLGLKDAATQLGFPTPHMSMYLGSSGRHLMDFEFGGTLPDGTTARTMTRSELYAMLRTEALRRGVTIEYGKRLVAVQEPAEGKQGASDGVRAVFADGTSASGDLVVGADGLKSAVRGLIDPGAPAPHAIPLLNTGGIVSSTAAAAALEGTELGVEPGRMKMVFGKRCFYCYIPDPSGRIWWFANPLQHTVADPTSMRPAELKDWLVQLVAGDSTPMAAIVGATEDIIRPYATFDFPTVPAWHRGRMVLVGDAAHAASPSSGQGASMAVEDAVTLGRALRDAGLSEVPAAFAAYEAERRLRAEMVVAWGRRSSAPKVRNQFTRVLQDLAMTMVFKSLAKRASDTHEWLYQHHIDWDAAPVGRKVQGGQATAEHPL
jgi:2-polyprenyl-6-methoxyphenol hydroxylase-like FAD-dependent oxidoreductase